MAVHKQYLPGSGGFIDIQIRGDGILLEELYKELHPTLVELEKKFTQKFLNERLVESSPKKPGCPGGCPD